MSIPRAAHTATKLGNGKVLVTGGNSTASAVSSAELYDSGTGTFSATGSMSSVASNHLAVLLGDGTVLVAGMSFTPERYQPATGTFSMTSPMQRVGTYVTSLVPLTSGPVLVISGIAAQAELFDPVTGTFSITGNLTAARNGLAAARLADGRVLVAGGQAAGGPPQLSSAEIYDPASGTFAATGSMASRRAWFTATLLPNGKVLVAGGQDEASSTLNLASAELYNPATNTFSPTGSMSTPRAGHTATLLSDGRVFIFGGQLGPGFPATAEIYDPATGVFTPVGTLPASGFRPACTLVGNGKVLISGGWGTDGTTPLATCWLY